MGIVLPALLQKLVGEFSFDSSQGYFEGNVAGTLRGGGFSGPQNEASNVSGKILEHFS